MRVYVATPYQLPQAHREHILRGLAPDAEAAYLDYRAQAAATITAQLQASAFHKGQSTWFYTPIAYEHGILGPQSDLRMNHDYWLEVDFKILEAMQGLLIVALPGWTLSTGIAKELKFMRSMIGTRILVHVPRLDTTTLANVTVDNRLRALDLNTDTNHYTDIAVSTTLRETVSYFAQTKTRKS